MKHREEISVTVALLTNILSEFLVKFISDSNFSLIIIIIPITVLLCFLLRQ